MMSPFVLFEKMSLLFPNLPFAFKSLKIEIKGVMPAPPVINLPSPLYDIAAKTSLIFNFSPAIKEINSLVTP